MVTVVGSHRFSILIGALLDIEISLPTSVLNPFMWPQY